MGQNQDGHKGASLQNTADKIHELIRLVSAKAPREGMNRTAIPQMTLYRESKPHAPKPRLYEPNLIFVAQGRKQSRVSNTIYTYDAGHFLTTLAPIPLECQVIGASREEPFLAISIRLERQRISQTLMKMALVEPSANRTVECHPSAIFTSTTRNGLLDAVVRLVKTLDSPAEAAVVGQAIIDEIYYRILEQEQGGALRHLLQKRGHIEQIARAVEHIHQNLSHVVSVEVLSSLVYMSRSGFHKKFKEVMHLSPVQYAKKVKLNTAQELIMQGMNVSEAGYKVGYNSPAQFSREYKRHFGNAPSSDKVPTV